MKEFKKNSSTLIIIVSIILLLLLIALLGVNYFKETFSWDPDIEQNGDYRCHKPINWHLL